MYIRLEEFLNKGFKDLEELNFESYYYNPAVQVNKALLYINFTLWQAVGAFCVRPSFTGALKILLYFSVV